MRRSGERTPHFLLSGCQMLCDGSADPFGCARDDGDLACEFFGIGFIVFDFVWVFAFLYDRMATTEKVSVSSVASC